MPEDILERFLVTSSVAIDFYLEHPVMIQFIVKSSNIQDVSLSEKVQIIFLKKFFAIFGDVETDNLNFNKERILELLRWLLLKTRNDFLYEISKNKNLTEVKEVYFDDRNFFIDILKKWNL